MQISINDRPVYFRKLFSTFFRYKWINLLIFLSSILTALVLYYVTEPVYESYTAIAIDKKIPQAQNGGFDISIAFPEENIETQIDILRSNFLLEDTIEDLKMGVRYYRDDFLKTKELYKSAPFEVGELSILDKELFNRSFLITDEGDGYFRLQSIESLNDRIVSALPFFKSKNSIKLNRTFKYSKPVYYKNSYFSIIKKRNFADQSYIVRFEDPANILERVKGRFSVQPASFKSQVLKISYSDNIAQRTKDFLDTYLHHYLHHIKKDLLQEQTRKLEFINKQLALTGRKLKLSELSLQKYKKRNNIADVKTQIQENIQRLNEFKQEYKNSQLEYETVKSLYDKVKRGDYRAVSSLSAQYPVLNNLFDELENLQIQKQQLDELYTYAHPKMQAMEASIEKVKESIQNITAGIYGRLGKRVSVLRGIIREYSNLLSELPKKEIELSRYENLFNINDKIYNYLLEKQSEIALKKASVISDKKVLDFPKLPKKRVRPKLSILLATWLFLGILGMIAHTFLRTLLDTKIKTIYDLQELTDIPVFGKIPYIQNESKYNKAYLLEAPNSKAAEAFRVIRNNLDYIVTKNRSKVILVTSSVPNEGKTTFAANLATILGMGEKKAIVLSFDLRKPQLHKKFGLTNEIGVSDLISGKKSFKQIVWQNNQYKNFYIVTSGKIPPNPTELISSSKTEKIIEELRKDFDYIVLDTPPVNYVSDTISMMKYADIVLFVVKSEFSEKKSVKEIDTLVKKLKIKNAGVILNSLKQKYDDQLKIDYSYVYHKVV